MRNAITNPYSDAYTYSDANANAKTYTYTKTSSEPADATVVGTVEAGVSPA